MNDALKLKNQLCFPLYACAKEVIRRYTPLLDNIGLTYTQYIAMLVLWEHECISVKELGKLLYLDSGTLTPMLKKMEKMGLIYRNRNNKDERIVMISITPKGKELEKQAACIPTKMTQCVTLDNAEAMQLYTLLYKLLQTLNN